jgi:hypothetical protein
MGGFRDAATGQGVSYGGDGQAQIATNITAQAPQQDAIAQAVQQFVGSGGNTAPGTPGIQVGQQAQQELNQQAGDLANMGRGTPSVDMDRSLTEARTRLQQMLDVARSRQGIGMGQFAARESNDQLRRQTLMQNMIQQALMGRAFA